MKNKQLFEMTPNEIIKLWRSDNIIAGTIKEIYTAENIGGYNYSGRSYKDWLTNIVKIKYNTCMCNSTRIKYLIRGKRTSDQKTGWRGICSKKCMNMATLANL